MSKNKHCCGYTYIESVKIQTPDSLMGCLIKVVGYLNEQICLGSGGRRKVQRSASLSGKNIISWETDKRSPKNVLKSFMRSRGETNFSIRHSVQRHFAILSPSHADTSILGCVQIYDRLKTFILLVYLGTNLEVISLSKRS
jgi:hypothetical protein